MVLKERAPEIEVTALIDMDRARAEELARKIGVHPPIFSSLEEALREGDFSAVDIMLPHDLHEQAAIRALEAGKHVLLEKPIAVSLAACARIFAAAENAKEKARVVFMVGENAQYWPEIREAKRLIDSGVIGEVQTAVANFTYPFGEAQRKQVVNQWRSQLSKAGGGIVIDGGSHWLRPLRMWMGEVHSVVAATHYPRKEMEGESLCHAVLRFQSGKLAYYGANMASTHIALQPWWKITGTKGELWIESELKGRLLLVNSDYQDPAGKLMMEPQGYFASFGHQLFDFSQAVLHGKPLEAGPESALMDLYTIKALYSSAKNLRWEQVLPLNKKDLVSHAIFLPPPTRDGQATKKQPCNPAIGVRSKL